MTKIALSQQLVKDIQAAVIGSQSLWEALDGAIQEELEKSRCWVDFHDGKPRALVGIGSGDIAHEIDVELDWEAYGGPDDVIMPADHIPSPAQIEDIEQQIAGIDKFTEELKKIRKLLADRLVKH